MKTAQEIKNFITEELSEEEQLYLWNTYCEARCSDSQIFTDDMFDEICEGMSASEVALKTFFGNFNPTEAYFTVNGYANFESSNYLDDLANFDDLAEYVHNYCESFDNLDLEEFLEEEEEA